MPSAVRLAALVGLPDPHRRDWLVHVAAAALASGLAACNVVPPLDLRAPKLEVADVSILDVGLSQLRFAVVVRADNPNDVDVPLTDLKFDLDLLGRPFASGIAAEPRLVLPRRAARDVPVEFTVPTIRLVELVGRLTGSGWINLSYRLKGNATWGSGFIPIPFEKSGDLDVLRRLREVLEPLGR